MFNTRTRQVLSKAGKAAMEQRPCATSAGSRWPLFETVIGTLGNLQKDMWWWWAVTNTAAFHDSQSVPFMHSFTDWLIHHLSIQGSWIENESLGVGYDKTFPDILILAGFRTQSRRGLETCRALCIGVQSYQRVLKTLGKVTHTAVCSAEWWPQPTQISPQKKTSRHEAGQCNNIRDSYRSR